MFVATYQTREVETWIVMALMLRGNYGICSFDNTALNKSLTKLLHMNKRTRKNKSLKEAFSSRLLC